ncbi:hypothetical protein EVG20_g10787 [Dentipellis fragilis]|uniref:Helicase ATP-binding domain-containing protein n=1 Tax=Dentipellis fragilis TaxID=205917 RepID=A0A4Y9XTL7_9AGAM|nr:hypothetical protein EVG20_g10787 [Dentipellis fragilis]
MVRTRRATASATADTAASTPTTLHSALFSTSNSKQTSQNATPATSVGDQEELPALANGKGKGKARTRAAAGRKRAAASSDEEELDRDRDVRSGAGANKRRVVENRAYVEITSKTKDVVKATPKNKGKGKAPASAYATPRGRTRSGAVTPRTPWNLDSDEIVPDSEAGLDYDESADAGGSANTDVLEESDESASDYEDEGADSEDEAFDSGEDSTPAPAPKRARVRVQHRKRGSVVDDDTDVVDVDEDADAEELMLDAAIRESIRSAHALLEESAGGAGPSGVPQTAAARAAAAIEHQLALEAGHEIDLDALSELSGRESSDEEPLVKGKAKAGAKKGKAKPKTKTKKLTKKQLRRSATQEELDAKRTVKAEERALRAKLGRKLTYAEKSTLALHRHHPELKDAWGDLEAKLDIVTPKRAEQPSRLKVTLLPFQQESLYWLRKQELGPNGGGLLADEMGMGKTIQMISLLVSEPGKPNLVIAPTVAVMQWRNEIAAHSDGLSVLVWHGANRESKAVSASGQSGFKRQGKIIKEKSALHTFEWNRIILDEAHNIKERATNTAKATFELRAKFRWCLSGTPLQNRVGELYSLIRFLGGDPFSYYFYCGHSPMQHTCFWNNEILTPIQKNGMVGPGKTAFKKLRILLDRIMLRRTKLQRADDLGLPPRTVIVRRDFFSPEEKELYLSLFSDAKRQFSTYLDAGTLLNNYSNIFSLLTRMRQMACHPDLVIRSKNNAAAFAKENLGEATVCRLCNDIAEDAIQAKCRHIFDRECIRQYLDASIEEVPACPVCHLALTIDLEAEPLELAENTTVRQGILGRLNIDAWRSSSKIEALVEELDNLRRQDATTKSIVFSQFVNFFGSDRVLGCSARGSWCVAWRAR